MELFVYLKFGVSFILLFVGGKMIAAVSGYHIPISVSLSVILATLIVAVVASIIFGKRHQEVSGESI